MLCGNCKSNLFLSIIMFTITTTLQSNDREPNPPLIECHWDASPASSKEKCIKRCLKYSGFYDKVSKKLICYGNEAPADVIGWTQTLCTCGYAFENKTRPGLPCIPKKEFLITTNGKDCQILCNKIKRYTYKSYNNVKVVFCDDNVNKAVSHQLEFVPNYHDKRLANTHGYHCQCAVRSSLISNLTESTNEPEKDQGNQDINYLKMCPMSEFYLSRKDRCTSTCNGAKAFIPQNSTELVCYHTPIPAQVISSEKCQCGITRNRANKPALACLPEIIHTATRANSDECKDICKSTRAFIFGRQYNSPELRLTGCAPFNDLPSRLFDRLEPVIGFRRKVTTRTNGGYERFDYPCLCGVGSILPLDFNVKKSTYFGPKYEWDIRNIESMLHHAPEMIAESSKSRSEKRPHSTKYLYDYELNVTETRKRKEVFKNTPAICRNDSPQPDRCRELVQSEEYYDIPTPPPVIPEIESLLHLMDNNLCEWEEPVGDHNIPSISYDDIEMNESPPHILFPQDNADKNNDKERGSSFQELHNPDFRQSCLPNIVAYMSTLFPNAYQQPSIVAPESSSSFDMVIANNQNHQPRNISLPSTNHHHRDYFQNEIGSLESLANHNFNCGSSSQAINNPDWRQTENNCQNIPAFDMSMFPNLELPSPPSVPAYNNLGHLMYPANQIIPPWDFNSPLIGCQHTTGSLQPTSDVRLEFLSNGMGRQELSSNAIGRQELLSNTIRRQKPLSIAMGRQESLPHLIGDEESLHNVMERSESLLNAIERQESLSNAMRRQEPLSNAIARQESLSNAVERQESLSNAMRRQEPLLNTIARQESLLNVVERRESLIGRHESLSNPMGRSPSISPILPELREKRLRRE